MKSKLKFLILSALFACILMQLKAQNYETTGVATIGSGILEGETYKSVVILGDPSASDDMLEGENISGGTGFIYVEEEPLRITSTTYPNVNVSVFPNPVSNYLTIRSEELKSREYQVEIRSIDGKVHVSKIWRSDDFQQLTLDVSRLDNSVYILTISSAKRLTQHYRFVKQ